MTKARVKPANWGVGEKLTSAQMNTSDAYWPDVIDGAAGGTWNPTNPIVIGGDGIHVTGLANLEGEVSIGDNAGSQLTIYADTFVNRDIAFIAGMTATFNGTAAFTDDLVMTGAGSFDLFSGSVIVTSAGGLVMGGGVDITMSAAANILLSATSAIDVNSGSIIISGATGLAVGGGVTAQFDGNTNIGATGVVTFDSGSDLDGSVELGLTCTGALSFASGATVAIAAGAELQISGILRHQSAGRTIYRRYTLPDANATVGVNDGTLFIVPALGAARVYTVSTTGAQAGDVIIFSAYANTTANLATVNGVWFLNFNGVAGQFPAVALYYDGAAWQTLWHSRI